MDRRIPGCYYGIGSAQSTEGWLDSRNRRPVTGSAESCQAGTGSQWFVTGGNNRGVSRPRLPAQLEPLHLDAANVRNSDRYADGMVENCSLKGLAAYQLELERISLRHVTLQDTRLEKLGACRE